MIPFGLLAGYWGDGSADYGNFGIRLSDPSRAPATAAQKNAPSELAFYD